MVWQEWTRTRNEKGVGSTAVNHLHDDYILITNLMHQLLFIHEIIFYIKENIIL